MLPGRFLKALAVVVVMIAAAPLCYILLRAVQAPAAAWFGVWNSQLPRLFAGSVRYAAATMGIAALLGFGLAWLVERTDLPGQRTWRWLLAMPLAMPAYVSALCYILLLRRGGITERAYMAVTGAPLGVLPAADIYSLGGAALVTALCVYPYVFLPVSAALRGGSRTLEEAARMLGCGGAGAFVRVTLPLVAPMLLGGTLLVGMYALSDFGTVSMLRYRTFTVAIYNQFAGQVDRSAAAVLSLVLIALTAPLLAGESLLARRGRRLSVGAVDHEPAPIPLGRGRAPATAMVAFVAAAALGVPTTVLAGLSISGWLAPTQVDQIWSVGSDATWRHGLNSVLLAAAAATMATAAALAPALLATRAPGRITTLLLAIGRSSNVLPGMLIGLALILLFNRMLPLLYGTWAALAIGLALRLLPQSMTTNEGALRAASPLLEQAACALGARRLQIFQRITLPVARRGIA